MRIQVKCCTAKAINYIAKQQLKHSQLPSSNFLIHYCPMSCPLYSYWCNTFSLLSVSTYSLYPSSYFSGLSKKPHLFLTVYAYVMLFNWIKSRTTASFLKTPSPLLSCNLQYSHVTILQLAIQQGSYLTPCNLAMFLSCNLQLSNVPILQLATQQCSYPATCNLAMFLSCKLQLSNAPILLLASQQCSSLPICNLAMFLSCNLQLNNVCIFQVSKVLILQLATQQCQYLTN